MTTATATALRTALDFAREELDLNDPRDGLIFDLQNAHEVLTKHGRNLGFLLGACADLIESKVWNADELQRLCETQRTDPHPYHGALRRSLQSKF